jgi:hypothetical protein
MRGIRTRAAGGMIMVYGFYRGIWGGISFVVTTRDIHALHYYLVVVFKTEGN